MTKDGMKHRSAVVRDSPILLNCCKVVIFERPRKSALISSRVRRTAGSSTFFLATKASVRAARSYCSCSTSQRGDSGWKHMATMNRTPGTILGYNECCIATENITIRTVR